MAKKKVTHQEKPPPNQDQQQQTHQTLAMYEASEKLESLKSLNAMLLKETAERRQQVGLLLQSNGSLESELTRSESEKASLQDELSRLIEWTVQLEVERNLVFVFIAMQVSQQAEVIERERERFQREKVDTARRMGSLEREVREVLREKSEIVKVKSEKESEIGLLKKKLNELVVEIEKERDGSSRVCQEMDEMRKELNVLIEAANGLQLKLTETEKRERKIQDEGQKLKIEYNGVLEDKEDRQRKIESMMRDKDSIERSLVESKLVIEEMKREIEGSFREKEGIEEERNVEMRKRNELENSVSSLKEMMLSLRKEEEKLRVNVVDLDKRCVEGDERKKQIVMEIDGLMEEKKEREKSFKSLIEENSMVLKDLDEALKQLGDQKRRMEEIVRGKTEVEEVKIRREAEISDLQKEVAKLGADIVTLEESCRGQVEKIKQLEAEVSHYIGVFGCVTIERDEARKGLIEEKNNVENLRLKMEKIIGEASKMVGEMNAENGNLIREKKELESKSAMLMKEIASVENSLSVARIECDGYACQSGVREC